MSTFLIILLGVLLGTAIGTAIVITDVLCSNDLGNSKASFRDFSVGADIRIISSRDKIRKDHYANAIHQDPPPEWR